MYGLAETKVASKLEKALTANLLIVLVGESGAGKSTLCDLINRPDNYYCSSKAIECQMLANNTDINHDTIHAFATKAYNKDPEWQVPQILDRLSKQKFMILDGPRRMQEVQALKKQHPNTIIVRLNTPAEKRYVRLQDRDDINETDFERILFDESQETELSQILAMADFTINNSGDINEFKKLAVGIQALLDNLTLGGTTYES